MSDDDLIRRGDARRILEEEGFLERSLANLNDLPAMQVGVKPGEGPQNRAIKTCKGCKHFHSEYWREPSGDGETWDSGTSATCLKANATISTYSGSEPSPPSWCPCAALTIAPAVSPYEHYDDYAIEQFAKMMREKMSASRAKGRSGWSDPEKCSVEYLRSLLYEHLDKGDPVDVANICMMLRHYEASTYREFCNCRPPAIDPAKVQALVEALKELLQIRAVWADPHNDQICKKARAALQRKTEAAK